MDQNKYRETFLRRQAERGYVVYSTWIPSRDKNRIANYIARLKKQYKKENEA